MAGIINLEILLIDLQCLPPINYYKLLVQYPKLKFEQYEHFQKCSYSNRYYLAGANGKILLSVPLLHARREKTPLRDLRICNGDKWQLIHWRTLISAYRRSPWFEFYEEDIHLLYEKKFEYLIDWNLTAFDLIGQWTGMSWQISMTEEYLKEYPNSEIQDYRNRIMPQNHLENPLSDFPKYRQVFEDRIGFLHGLSILDWLFCEGKRVGELLKNRNSFC